MPYRVRAEELLARWREAERRHASTTRGTLEFEKTRLEILELRRSYQEAVNEVEEFELPERQPVPQPVD
jgi:DNA-binding response OmpR family regulator